MKPKTIIPMRAINIPDTSLPQLRFPILVSEKLNGFRALSVNDTLQSKSGEPFPSSLVREKFSGLIHPFDSELVQGNPLNKDCLAVTKSAVGSREFPPILTQDDLTLYVFDLHSYIGDAFARYDKLLSLSLPKGVKLIEKTIVRTLDQLMEYESKVLASGHEGIIGNLLTSYYIHGESSIKDQSAWKRKPSCDEEFTVTGFEEQYQNLNPELRTRTGKLKRSTNQVNLLPKDTLGALLVHSPTWGACRIGTGFTNELRKLIWNNKQKVLGAQVTASYLPTVSNEKPQSLTFKCFRPNFDIFGGR